mgnify:CR=1 FL=1
MTTCYDQDNWVSQIHVNTCQWRQYLSLTLSHLLPIIGGKFCRVRIGDLFLVSYQHNWARCRTLEGCSGKSIKNFTSWRFDGNRVKNNFSMVMTSILAFLDHFPLPLLRYINNTMVLTVNRLWDISRTEIEASLWALQVSLWFNSQLNPSILQTNHLARHLKKRS